MKLPRRNFLHLAAGAAVLPAVSRIARAQAYPSRPVHLIVGFPDPCKSLTYFPGVGPGIHARSSHVVLKSGSGEYAPL